jgi:hypothetical protein
MTIVPDMGEAEVRGSQSKAGLSKSLRPYLKKTGGVAQMAECLPSKHKTLNSITII